MFDSPHILIVDDDDRLRALLAKFLGEQGFMVTTAAGAAQARRLMHWFTFDLLVLDVMMPKETGLELLKSLAENRAPALMLSAMGEAQDRIRGLETGAEDYLAKPFEPKELALRVKSILRRAAASEKKSRKATFGAFAVDLETGHLTQQQRPVYLTGGEAALLKILAEQGGEPVSRERLARLLGGVGNERSVDVQIARLRKKIEASEKKPVHLQTVRGAGYVLYVD